MKISIDLLSTELTILFNELLDHVENEFLKNKLKNVTQIKLDSCLKPTDQ